jgi:tRNA threonylcarbamoyladenosine biosynthesis protein TsaE
VTLLIPLESRRATIRLGQRLAAVVAAGDLIILSGELGAGKTFLTRGIARALGLPARIRVVSPTFGLVLEYATQPRLVHADLYRLTQPHEVAELGLLEQRDDGALLIVEWGEPYARVLGGDALLVRLECVPRRAGIECTGSRSRELLKALRHPEAR